MDLLIWEDKHGDLIYKFDTVEDRRAAVLDIIKRRLEMGYFYDDSEDESRKILETENLDDGLRFLRDRRDHEYEEIMVTSTIDV